MSLVEHVSDTERAQRGHAAHTAHRDSADNNEVCDSYMWKERVLKGGAGPGGGGSGAAGVADGGSDSDVSEQDSFVTRGAFLLTPSHGLSVERAAALCDKMELKGCLALTKTATGILFKFSDLEDYHTVFRRGFHRVTGSRFYRKVAIPCRPPQSYSVLVLDVPRELPEDDLRRALAGLRSLLTVARLPDTGSSTPRLSPDKSPRYSEGDPVCRAGGPVLVTVSSLQEARWLLQRGLDFFGATYFPTEPAAPGTLALEPRSGSLSSRVRELLPVFDPHPHSLLQPRSVKSGPPSRLVQPRK